MREFELSLTKCLKEGLQRYPHNFNTVSALQRCVNLIITQDDESGPSLKGRRDIVDVCDGALPIDYVRIVPDLGDGGSIARYLDVLDFGEFSYIIAVNSMDAVVNFTLLTVEGRVEELTRSLYNFTAGIAYDNIQAVMILDREIWWSKIGKFDFDITTNEAGRMIWPFPGVPHTVKQLGKYVVVYGNQGVMALEPLTTMAGAWRKLVIKDMQGLGTHSSYPIGVLPTAHVFVGSDYRMYLITDQLKISCINYTDIIRKQLDAPPYFKIIPDEKYKAFYITDYIRCFYLTEKGMTEVTYFPSIITGGTISTETDNMVFGTPVELSDKDSFMFITTSFDAGFRSRKHVSGIDLSCNAEYPLYASIGWRNDMRSVWRFSSEVRVNPQGYTAVPCSGVDLCVKIRGKLSPYLTFESLTVKIKFEDKRFIRSRYDNKTFA